jgi:diadenosine tetraphosphatase ApaH/serine/threonine PP2A family protein phosphatase
VLELIEGHASSGAIVVLGNHDAAALGRPNGTLAGTALASGDWTRAQLGPRHRAFLASLPLTVEEDNVLYVHASAAAPEQWIYITGAREAAESIEAGKASYIFSGHVHEQKLYYTGASGRPMEFHPVSGTPIPVARQHRWLAIVGSAGQPRDGNNAACYALFDTERERLTFFRVRYDYPAAIRKIRAAGLPDRLALRLERGT